MSKKRGVFFSLDAIVALGIILTVIIIAFPQIQKSHNNTELPKDILTTLSSLKVSDLDDVYIMQLVSQGVLDGDKSLIEQIGILSIENETLAKNLTSIVLQNLNTKENLGIWYGNKLIFNSNVTGYENSSNILTERYIVSGLSGLNSSTSANGYSARGFLSSTYQTKYEYFGGYVGDGNISKRISYSGTINSADLELAINNNFTVYINGISVGTYAGSSSETTPVRYSLDSYLNYFNQGNNLIEFRGRDLYVAGGHIRITYDSNGTTQQDNKTYLPGINGTVNLYDGIATEGQLESMNVFLHYNIPYSSFLKVGNITVWNNSAVGENTATIPNSYLTTILNYNSLSNTTTPIRFGSENLSLNINISQGNADIILITDVSGSMGGVVSGSGSSVVRNCADPLLYSSNTEKLSLAKCLDEQFVYAVLNGNNNRVGLVDFSISAGYVNLTSNVTLLNNTIYSYGLEGTTCVSCAINSAHMILQSDSPDSTRRKYIIVMTDGVANVRSTNICENILGSGTNNSISSTPLQVGESGASSKYNSQYEWSSTRYGSTIRLNKVDGINNTLAFAVGENYQVWKWNSTNWTMQTDLPGSQELYGIDLFNSSLGFAVGTHGKIAVFNGVSWSEYQDTGTENFKDIQFVNDSTAFAVGDSGKIFKWNGTNTQWYQLQDTGNQDFRAIDMFNNTYGLIAGSDDEIWAWNGTRWGLQQSGLTPTFTDLEIFNSSLSFATTTSGTIMRKVGTGAWTDPVSLGEGYNGLYSLNTITIINSTYGFVAGDGREGIVEWNGRNWTRFFPKYSYEGNATTGVICSDPDTCSLTQTAPMLNANYSSCRANRELNATIHSIGFGNINTCTFANITLQAIADCGNGSFFTSDDATQLQQIYSNISQNILQLSYSEQTAVVGGNTTGSIYPDSYIELNYKKLPRPFGLQITLEEQFQNSTSGTFSVYPNSSILSARATSYSGARWTNKLILNAQRIAYDI